MVYLYLLHVICILISAHSDRIRGLAIDSVNQQVITAGADCKVKVQIELFFYMIMSIMPHNVMPCEIFFGLLQFWNFKARKLLHSMTFEAPIAQILLHRER